MSESYPVTEPIASGVSRIDAVRACIRLGVYETRRRTDVAIERLLDDIAQDEIEAYDAANVPDPYDLLS